MTTTPTQIRIDSDLKKQVTDLFNDLGLDLSLLDEVVDTLRQGSEVDKKSRDHGLSGKFQGIRGCHIKPD